VRAGAQRLCIDLLRGPSAALRLLPEILTDGGLVKWLSMDDNKNCSIVADGQDRLLEALEPGRLLASIRARRAAELAAATPEGRRQIEAEIENEIRQALAYGAPPEALY
jgi:hypothetical protein